MPDVVSQGQDRGSRSWPGRLAAITVLAALLAVVAVEHLGPHRRPAPHHRPRPAASPLPPPARAAAASRGAAAGLPQVPDGIIGQSVLRDRGFRLPVTGTQPAWFWPATGRTAPIGGLPRASLGYVFIRVGRSGWAVQPNPAAQAGCGNCAGPPRPVYFVADDSGSATRIGAA